MRRLRGILKNTFLLTCGQLSAKVLGVIFVALLARAVGPDGVGKFVFATSLIAIFMMLPNFGFDILLVREVSKSPKRAKEFISNVLTMKLLIGIIASFLAVSFVIWRGYDYQTIQVILIVLVSAIFMSILSTFYSIFRAYERMEFEAILVFLNSSLRVVFGIVAITAGLKLNGILLAVLFSDALSFSLSSIIIRYRFKVLKLKINFGMIQQIFRYSIPFGILALIDVVFSNTDNLMIAKLVNETAVGWYSAANRILLFLIVIPNMFMNAIFPVLSRLSISSDDALQQTYSKSFYYMLMVAFPVAVGGFLVSDMLIPMIYGDQFRNSVLVFQIMVWVTMFSFVGYVNGATLNATGREKMFACVMGFAAFANIILDYVFIMKFGYIGACYSTLLLACLGFIIYSTICHRQLNIKPEWATIAKSLAASVMMAGIVLYLKQVLPNVFIIIPAGGVAYFAFILLLKAIPKEDTTALLSLVRRRSTPESYVN